MTDASTVAGTLTQQVELYVALSKGMRFEEKKAFWDADEVRPLLKPEESATVLVGWPAITDYWSQTRRSLKNLESRCWDVSPVQLDQDLALVIFKLAWRAEVDGPFLSGAPLGALVRVSAFLRRKDGVLEVLRLRRGTHGRRRLRHDDDRRGRLATLAFRKLEALGSVETADRTGPLWQNAPGDNPPLSLHVDELTAFTVGFSRYSFERATVALSKHEMIAEEAGCSACRFRCVTNACTDRVGRPMSRTTIRPASTSVRTDSQPSRLMKSDLMISALARSRQSVRTT